MRLSSTILHVMPNSLVNLASVDLSIRLVHSKECLRA